MDNTPVQTLEVTMYPLSLLTYLVYADNCIEF